MTLPASISRLITIVGNFYASRVCGLIELLIFFPFLIYSVWSLVGAVNGLIGTPGDGNYLRLAQASGLMTAVSGFLSFSGGRKLIRGYGPPHGPIVRQVARAVERKPRLVDFLSVGIIFLSVVIVLSILVDFELVRRLIKH